MEWAPLPDTSDAFSCVPTLGHFVSHGGLADTKHLFERIVQEELVDESAGQRVNEGRAPPLRRTTTPEEEKDLEDTRTWLDVRRSKEGSTLHPFSAAWLPAAANWWGGPPTPRTDRLDNVEFSAVKKVIRVLAAPEQCRPKESSRARSRAEQSQQAKARQARVG